MLSLYAISPSYPLIELLGPPNFSKQSILIHYVLLAMGHRDNKELEQQQQQQKKRKCRHRKRIAF